MLMHGDIAKQAMANTARGLAEARIVRSQQFGPAREVVPPPDRSEP
jgi:hypothetical protein